ncbi:MAG: VanZ family protein [Clostridia bacterium]|nr:VanZ family protein [Clostridia bacterium]
MKIKGLLKISSTFLVLSWMIVVFLFSSQNGKESNRTSGIVINKINTVISSEKDLEQLQIREEEEQDVNNVYNYPSNIQSVVRKNAHYFLYLVGGVLLSIFFYIFVNMKYAILTMIIGILYAISDEFHQIFVPGRTSSIVDVGIDTLGIMTGLILFIMVYQIFKKNCLYFKK